MQLQRETFLFRIVRQHHLGAGFATGNAASTFTRPLDYFSVLANVIVARLVGAAVHLDFLALADFQTLHAAQFVLRAEPFGRGQVIRAEVAGGGQHGKRS